MPKFKSFFKLAEYKFREQDSKLGKLLDKFLGLGVCKHCGFEHPSIDKYCEQCLELGFELGVKLFKISDCEYHIRKKGETRGLSSTHKKEDILVRSL